MGVYHIPRASMRGALNPAAVGQGCQGQELLAWLGRLPKEHREGMAHFCHRAEMAVPPTTTATLPIPCRLGTLINWTDFVEQRALETMHSPHSQ